MSQLARLQKNVLILFSCFLAQANCQCVLNFLDNLENMPKYRKFFGKNAIEVPYTEPNILVEQGENITGYCANTFKYFETTRHYFKNEQRETLYCDNEIIHHSEDGLPLVDELLICLDLSWKMYESNSPISWCPYPTGSFILGTKMSDQLLILAAACFNVKRNSFQTLNYLVGPQIHTEDHNDLQFVGPIGLNETILGEEVKNFRTFFNHLKISKDAKERHKFWISLADYEYQSIVQGGPYTKFFSKYDTLLDIVWWPSLAAGNWKRFMQALDVRTKTYTYNVFVGTSGVVQVPYKDKCTPQEFEDLQLGNQNRTLPAYIWTYIKAPESGEEFVFIGYNAPFYEVHMINCLEKFNGSVK